MKLLVACLVRSIVILLALPAEASMDPWSIFSEPSPIFIDARDAVSWDAGQSIDASGDIALQQIREQVRIAQPSMPAYEPGTG